jgi:hypothetical protein
MDDIVEAIRKIHAAQHKFRREFIANRQSGRITPRTTVELILAQFNNRSGKYQ